MKNVSLSDLIREFALQQVDRFSLDALLAYVGKKQKGFSDEDRLYDLACESAYLFEDDREIFADLFYPRHLFFQDAEFLATPLPEEVEGGFLFPGHRFIPFISREIFPGEATLKLPDGSSASAKRVELPQSPVMRALIFFGQFGAMDYLLRDDESNMERLGPGSEQALKVTVLDLKDFYAAHSFKAGDSLLLTVEDWLNGVYSVRAVPKDRQTIDFASSNEWVRGLRFGFDESLLDAALDHDCYEQMARALWQGDSLEDSPMLLKDPPLTLAAFFNAQKDIKLETMGQVSFFWPEDQPLDSRMQNSLDGAEPEAESELDLMFSQLGLSVDVQETEAYMRDALARGEREWRKTLARVIQGRTLWFPTSDEQDTFYRLFSELWEDVRTRYNPETDVQREARSVFLELNDLCLKVLRDLDQSGRDPVEIVNHPATLQLGELSGMIHSVLVVCNEADDDMVQEMNMSLNEMAHDLRQAIEGLARDLQHVGQMDLESEEPVYQLKISLKNASPPIWRRVLVPAGIGLVELNDVIQAAFGWTNSHLHQFQKGRVSYEPNPEDDWGGACSDDSRNFCLRDLLSKEKAKIEYEYDFGDSWKHAVLLEKILEPEPDQSLPVCIKGMRACPPEDCGGIHGYYHLLEILDGSGSKEERKELLAWLGGPIDPEAFDLEEANARLRARCT